LLECIYISFGRGIYWSWIANKLNNSSRKIWCSFQIPVRRFYKSRFG